MLISFSASGKPADVVNAINQQAKAFRLQNPGAEATVVTVRDQINRDVKAQLDDASVSVSATLSISVMATAAPRPIDVPKADSAKAPAIADTK